MAAPSTPSLEHAVVADAMHKGFISCPPDAPARELARLMALRHAHCVIVMHRDFDGSGQPYVWGIVSDLDLVEAMLGDEAPGTASSLAHQPVVTVTPSTPLTDACGLMVEHRVSHLVVAEGGTPVGVLATSDAADAFAWGEA